MPLSALSLTQPDGRALIAPWLAAHGTQAWTARLLTILQPVWRLMTHHGIALEAHGQNLLITHDGGWPTGLVARDFSESLEYMPDRLSLPAPDLAAIEPAMAGAPDGTYNRMGRATDLRDLVADCLITHVLSDLADLLHRTGHLPEAIFWRLARAALPHAPSLRTDAATVPAESLAAGLLGRTETHPAPNPLKEPAMTRLFHLNDTLIDPFGPDAPDLLAGRDPDRTRIALLMTDRAACLTQILRLRDAGASCHPIHPETPPDQARDLARRAGCDLMMTDAGLQGLGQDAPHAPGGVLIQTSSGTTGAPKIIARSWAAIQTEIDAYRARLSAGGRDDAGDRGPRSPFLWTDRRGAGRTGTGTCSGGAGPRQPRAILRQLAVPRSADLCRTAAAACAGAVGRGAGAARGDVVGDGAAAAVV